MENNKKKKDWKELLLGSGLPLEHDVSSILEKYKIYSYGEYSYTRINENGQQTEHSVDIDAEIRLESATLYLLIECKYRNSEKRWFFYPTYRGTKELGQLRGDRLVKILEYLSPAHIVDDFRRFEAQFDVCAKGVEILADKKDEHSIKHGLSQLQYALPNQILNLTLTQAHETNDGNLDVKMIVPVLITTAPLYVINDDVDITSIYNAKHVDEVVRRVNSLVVYCEPSNDLLVYTDTLFEKARQHPDILMRIKQLNELWNARAKAERSLFKELHDSFNRSSTKVLVVEYNSLEAVIKKLIKAFKSSANHLDKFATLRNDFDQHKSYLETKTWFEVI